VILIDTNIIMYAAGAPHTHKGPSVRMLEQVAAGEVEATIDAEVLQEILHRYRAINRWDDGKQVYDLTRRLFPVVIPVTAAILDRARQLLDTDATIMARDALHAAVVLEERLDGVISFDHDFDRIAGVVRREP
jgi:predicted nucleic acid-binding protein